MRPAQRRLWNAFRRSRAAWRRSIRSTFNRCEGTGENGRIRKEDIIAHLAQQTQPQRSAQPPLAPAPKPATPAVPVTAMEGDQLINPSPARRVIAEHMVRSKHTSPHATTLFEVDMTQPGALAGPQQRRFQPARGLWHLIPDLRDQGCR